jgi:hypothetical protein
MAERCIEAGMESASYRQWRFQEHKWNTRVSSNERHTDVNYQIIEDSDGTHNMFAAEREICNKLQHEDNDEDEA